MRSLLRLLVLALLPGVAAAQFPLRVRVVDQESQRPLGGALVSAIGMGSQTPAVLASGDGTAVLRVPAIGTYRVLVRRIGYQPFTSDTVRVTGTSSVAVTIVVPGLRIALSTVRVTARRECDGDAPGASSEAGPLWEEVRKALETSVLSRGTSFIVTTGMSFRRTLADDGRLMSEDTTAKGTAGARPFKSETPDVLERSGYVTGGFRTSLTFNAPDEQVLLSPGFLRMHCLSMAQAVRRSGDTTLIGLAFEPRSNNQLADITGTVWVDSATSELRRLEFSYVRAPLPFAVKGLGGSVDYRRHRSGAWFVSSWIIRMPRWRSSTIEKSGVGLAGFAEVGGVASVQREAAALPASQVRTVTGSVFDSLGMRDLTGTVVRMPALGRETTTDFLGRFRFDSVAVGIWDVETTFAPLEAVGQSRLASVADLVETQSADLYLYVPALTTVWKSACPGRPMPQGSGGFVTGLVRTPAGVPLAEAAVEFAWREAGARATDTLPQVRVMTDSTGRYFACVGSGSEVTAVATRDSTVFGVPVTFSFVPARTVARDFVVGTDEEVDRAAADSANVVDALDRGSGGAVAGTVRDAGGRPVSDVRIRLVGVKGETRTTGQGRFTYRGVPPGQHVVSIEVIGFERARRVVRVEAGDTARLDVRLGRLATLAAVNIRERERVHALRVEIDQRVLASHGYISDSSKIMSVAGYRSLFEVPGARVRTLGNSFTVEVQRVSFSGRDQGLRWCTPALYIDDAISDTDKLMDYPRENIALVEFYSRAANAPLRYTGSGAGSTGGTRDGTCGAILVWTKQFLRAADMTLKPDPTKPPVKKP